MNNQTKTMYNVVLTIERSVGGVQNPVERTIDQEELDKTLGRYTRNYGPPIELTNGRDNIKVFEFYRWDAKCETTALIKYWRVADSSSPPAFKQEQKKEDVKHPEQVQALLTMGALEETNRWGY